MSKSIVAHREDGTVDILSPKDLEKEIFDFIWNEINNVRLDDMEYYYADTGEPCRVEITITVVEE